MLVTVYFYIDVVLLARLSSAEEVGLYTAAYRFVQFGVFVPGVLVTSVYALAAHLAERDRPRFGAMVTELLSLAILLFPIPLLLLAVAARDVMVLLFGTEFAAAGSALTLLAGGLAVMMLTGALGPMLIAVRRERANLAIGATAVVFNIGLNLILIPQFDADGAALATLLTELLVLALAFALLRRVAPVGIHAGQAAKAAASAAAAAGIVLLLPAPVAVRLATGLGVYVALLLATGALGRRQLQLTRAARASAMT